jgi:AcrR family transcriptional regulator
VSPKNSSGHKGRPRSFDADYALDRALNVFREKGYEGASLSDLTEAMGINRPSMYAAFGDKRSLFHKALERYSDGPALFMREALNEKTARGVAERLLRGAVEMNTSAGNPPGCLMVQGALACGTEAECVRQELISHRSSAEKLLIQRFKRAKAEGDLAHDVNPTDLARFLTSVMYGMSVQAASGASRGELVRIAKTAMQAWPR